ncbi:MAG TPA: UPF0182 family protein [Candidatus Mcinerneyibacterium sp.]|nr:UPF0182 family protein [Candidatus Mcinerneyibacterium sp.]
MFFIIGVIFFALGCIPFFVTLTKNSSLPKEQLLQKLKKPIYIILGDIAIIILVNIFFHFYSEFLWFSNLNFKKRFLKVLSSKIYLFIFSFIFSYLFMFFNLKKATGKFKRNAYSIIESIVPGILAIYFSILVSNLWHTFLLYFNQSASELVDPVFSKPINFYLFSLPLYSALVGRFIVLLFMTIILIGIFILLYTDRDEYNNLNMESLKSNLWNMRKQISFIGSLFLFSFAFSAYLNIFELLYSKTGIVTGAGYTDIHIRTLGYRLSFIIYFIAAIYLFLSSFIDKLNDKIFKIEESTYGHYMTIKKPLIKAGIGIAVILIAINSFLPGIVQGLIVEPNEISKEEPYIINNINFTKKAYAIDERNVTEKNYPIGRKISQNILDKNKETLDNIRLWDERVLMDNLSQQQEIRLYYEFHDVDVDRYILDGKYTQVMISLREMEKTQISARSQTWISRHFKYTHGYGAVLLPAHEILPQGRPNLLIKNIPPEESINDITLKYPQIYYGERTNDHVYVNTEEKEFDYPKGDKNIYSDYKGTGGVVIDNLLKRFLFAWKYDGYKVIFSTYFDKDTRIMFHRNIKKRINKIAPFLILDDDAYPVITDKGRIKYIVDAYTISNKYPYSEKYKGALSKFYGLNYIRNSVKVVVDAFNGSMNLYIVDETDTIINTYKKIFPEIFKNFDKMPDFLKKHIRYPKDYFKIQAEIYSIYHMGDPDVFYQQEDVWEFATERYRSYFQKINPYYVMVNLPESNKMEFISMIPFTPKNKNVMNAWMAARCDIPNYGKLMVFPFPKGVEMLGPRQIEARIDQNSVMSKALSLWSQRGSEVIRGNMLAIPLFNEEKLYIMYVEPIFLQAENAKLPEIKKVVISDQDDVVWADDFQTALQRLVEGKVPEELAEEQEIPQTTATQQGKTTAQLINEANQYFNEFQSFRANNNFVEAEKSFNKLKAVLEELRNR